MPRRDGTRSIVLAVAATLALGLAGMGGLGAGSQVRASDAIVKVTDSAYDPKTVTVTAGSVVTWNNTGTKAHTVTADDGSFDSGQLSPGDAFGNLFDTAGTFTYHDADDPTTKGSVVVKPAAPTPTPNGTPRPTPPPGTLPPNFKTPPPVATPEPSVTSAPPATPIPSGAASGTAPSDLDPLIVGIVAVALVAAVVLFEIWRRRRTT